MALMGPDGETHSHLDPQRQRADGPMLGAELPDRGRWVGPRAGDPVPLERPQSTLPPDTWRRHYEPVAKIEASRASAPADGMFDLNHPRRTIVRTLEGVGFILDHVPTTAKQRDVLQAAYDCLNKL